jgi:drug/metabolite transporter (DMT)-like permease
VIFGERLDGTMIVGCLVVIGSGLFILWNGKVSAKAALPRSTVQDPVGYR